MDRRAFIAGAAALALAPRGLAEIEAGREVALLTADLESRLVAVDLETGRVLRYVPTLPRPDVALRFRVARSVRGGRLVAGIACVLLIPVATVVPALVALALVAGVWVALHAYELIWWREARAQLRAQRLPSSS
jgi:hypothetical protein